MTSATIIIPVLNGDKYIERCINSIRGLNLESICLDIIVIDNGSTDNTLKILNRLKVYYEIHCNKNISEIRNIGASLARSNYIGFVDSDCLVEPNWLIEAIRLLESDVTIGIVGRFYLPGDNPTWVENVWCERRLHVEGPVDFLPAGNMVMRKDVFSDLLGFSNNVVTGEDYELCQRARAAGYKVYNSKLVTVKHLGNMKRLKDIIKKERWYGFGMFSTLKLGHFSKPLISTIMFDVQFIGMLFAFKSILIAKILSITILLQLTMSSIMFTRTIKVNRLKHILLCMPIVFCYLVGRSISVYDKIKYEISKR